MLAGRKGNWSARTRHRLLGHALMVPLTVAALVAAAQILSVSTSIPAAAGSGARLAATAGAAGKFGGLAALASEPAGGGGSPGVMLLLGIWLAGVLVLLLRLVLARLAARKLVAESAPVLDHRALSRAATLLGEPWSGSELPVRLHPELEVPLVAGVLRPVLLLPVRLTEAPRELDMALVHELGHVRCRDALTTLLADVATACLWFLPSAHRTVRDLRLLQELAADRAVIDAGFRPSSYASFLLHTFRRARRSTFEPPAATHPIASRSSTMDTRLRALLSPSTPSTAHVGPTRTVTWAVSLLVSLALALASLAAASELRAQSDSPPRLDPDSLDAESLDRLLRPLVIDTMTARYIAGSAVAVVHRGRLVYAQGFGHARKYEQVPADAEKTVWRIGSITKVLTGVAVMQLVDRGLVDLDTDVNEYLTAVRVPATFEEPVTVRHLLTHTAGFDQIGLGRHAEGPEEVLPTAEFLDGNLVRIRPPGVVSTYDTYAITLAGLLVEEVSGLGYREYLRRHLFEPLAMERSGIALPPELQDDTAIGYGFAGTWEEMPWEHMNTDPASTVNASATDMANLALMLLDEGRFGGRRVLSEESVEAMLRRQFSNHPEQPGYGLTLWEDRSFGVDAFSHAGSMAGFGAMLYLVPEHELGVFIVCNQESGVLVNAALSALVEALLSDEQREPQMRQRLDRSPDLERFTGTWADTMHHHTDPSTGWKRRPFELSATEDGDLLFRDRPAIPVGPLTFQLEDGLLLTFRENEDGEITYFFVHQTVYERVK